MDEYDEQPLQDILAHYDKAGPVAAAQSWLRDVLENGDIAAVWPRTDPVARLAVVQAFLWANREHERVRGRDLDATAAQLVADAPTHELWADFAETQLDEWRQRWSFYDSDTYGAASRPRPVGIDLELVLFTEAGGEIVAVERPTLVEALVLLMHSTPSGWLVANWNSDRLPEPGWPPKFHRATAPL